MNIRVILALLVLPVAAITAGVTLAQDKGSVDPKPLPPLANPNDPKIGAKELFGRKLLPRCQRASSASTPRAASPARNHCRSMAAPGR
jgi:hypothetical protein